MLKESKLKSILFLVMLLSLSSSSSVHVFSQKVTSYSFDKTVYYQGDSGSLSVTIVNDHPNFQISTKQCYLQFDWQQTQNLVYDSGATPIIASGSSYTFSIPFGIPNNIAAGWHQYKIIWVDKGILLGTVVVETGSLYVHDAYEKVYLDLRSNVVDKLNVQLNANYKSPDAQSLLSQAQSAYQRSITLANQGKFQDASNDMTTASNLLDQAAAAEKSYVSNPLTLYGNPQLWYVIIIGIILVAALMIILRDKSSKTETSVKT